MKCPNCGNEITGKFCTSCGTPAPVEEPVKEQETQTQPAQSDNFAANNYNSEPAQQNVADNNSQPNNFGTDNFNAQPNNFGTDNSNAQPNNFGANNYNSQPVGYSGASTPSNGMPVNNGYTGQQFTNVPNNTPNQPKKGMSGGKVAAIVISVILGIMIILAVVVGVVACNFFKTVGSVIGGVKEGVSIFVEDNESKYNSDSSAESSERNYDIASHFYYQEINDGSEIEITGYNYMDTFDETFTDKNFEIRVPNEINGKPVTSVYEIYVYNYSNIDTDDLNMKLIIPGSVKNIESYALWGLDGVTEIVFEDGVESIGDYAVYNCKYLKKITIPESVTNIDDVGVGYLDSNEENVISKDLVIVAKKGSAAEKYAQDNGFKVENN
ncbi:leucine-rich repeat protein [Ruminococcus sp.]|uniref:leucine-rich repeat protein n=1 Tax=Ruminococcus sp. TaxID=41978 RepID=UPI003F7D0916